MNLNPIILLVDDDIDDQDFFIDALEVADESIQCITANDGEEALSILQGPERVIPDFIFLDQNMPRLSGLKCLRELKKLEYIKNVPIIMYSTSHAEKDKTEATFLGANYFFIKTHSFKELVDYLKNITQVTAKTGS